MVSLDFFHVKLPVVLIEIPYCDKNEFASKQFIKKFKKFTNDKCDIRIKWLTRKMKTFFDLKDLFLHPALKIYKGVCICRGTYIGESIGCVETGWKEHNTPQINQIKLKHVNSNLDHIFTWSIICNAPTNKFKWKIIEANIIVAIIKLTLNDQLHSDLLHLLRNGIT